MHRLSTSFILGYHGCSKTVADRLLAGRESFSQSTNDYDWLGPGVYFWQSNPLRALQFAKEKRSRENAKWTPAVVGAIIDPRSCLDLATSAGVDQVRTAYDALQEAAATSQDDLPKNRGGDDLVQRYLDCAVLRMLHDLRSKSGELPIDTISGIFIEGDHVYENAGFFDKTHIQICVCSISCIIGVFRVSKADLS